MSEYSFGDRFQAHVPKGESIESGYCFRDALRNAGINTDLPAWVHSDDFPMICEELGLKFTTGRGRKLSIKRDRPIIIGYTIERRSEGEKHIGHYEYFDKADKARGLLEELQPEDLFAVIEFPQQKY